jgi:hypothetical protein
MGLQKDPPKCPILGFLAGVPFIYIEKQCINLIFTKDCLLDISLPRGPDPAETTFGALFDPFLALLRNHAQNALLSSLELMVLKWASKRASKKGLFRGFLACVPVIYTRNSV